MDVPSPETASRMTVLRLSISRNYFAMGPGWERPIFEAVLAHLESLGPMTVEPVSVGIFIKSNGSFVELRPKSKWVALSFPLGRRISHARLARKPIGRGRKIVHFVNLGAEGEVDQQVRDWLTESFDHFGVGKERRWPREPRMTRGC